MQLSCISLRKYLGKVRIFRAAAGKYLGNEKILKQRKPTFFEGQSFQIQKNDDGWR